MLSDTPFRDRLRQLLAVVEPDDAPYEAELQRERDIELAREALRRSSEPRSFTLTDEQGNSGASFFATSGREAKEIAESQMERWSDGEGDPKTEWHDATLTGEDGTDTSLTVRVDPAEPDCSAGKHDWQSPHDIVGGCESNPGVHGHGGGVVITEVCVHCGCSRTTDTWAQRPDTGEQGLTSVAYGAGRYAEEVVAYRLAQLHPTLVIAFPTMREALNGNAPLLQCWVDDQIAQILDAAWEALSIVGLGIGGLEYRLEQGPSLRSARIEAGDDDEIDAEILRRFDRALDAARDEVAT